MRKSIRLTDKEQEEVLSRLSKAFGLDMQDAFKRAKEIMEATTPECYTLEQLDEYVHGEPPDADIDAHLKECSMCSRLVAMIKELSLQR